MKDIINSRSISLTVTFIFLILLNPITFFSQTASGQNEKDITRKKPINTDSTQNYLFTVNYQGVWSPIGKTIGAQGALVNYGINVARFFSPRIVLGFTFELKLVNILSLFVPNFGVKQPSNKFITDFNSSFNSHYNTPVDSANAYIVKNALNNPWKGGIMSTQQYNIGIMFSPFPQSHGGFLIQFKLGTRAFPIHNGVYQNKALGDGSRDYINLEIREALLCELMCKPMAFFKNTILKKTKHTKNRQYLLKSFVIGVFYERLDLRNTSFNGTPLTQMVNNDFISKYGIDNRFGLKAGFAIY